MNDRTLKIISDLIDELKKEKEKSSSFEVINKLQHFAIEKNLDMKYCEDIADVFIKYVNRTLPENQAKCQV